MTPGETVRVGRRTVPMRNPDKVLFPDDGLSKADLAEHYRQAASVLLPHVRGRPLMLLRYPDGIDRGGFVQQEIPEHFPDWIERATVPREGGGKITHAVATDTATLVYLAGQAVITPHPWLSRADRPEHPDRLVLDLDPSGDDFGEIRYAARFARDLLDEVGLASYVMTTGSRGMHVTVPLQRRHHVDDVRRFARDVAQLLARRSPERLTVEQRKDKRGNRVYLDAMRNGYGQTAVPPYGVRPRPGAPFATPLTWDEVDERSLRPDRWRIGDLARRLDQQGGDPWAGIGRHAGSLAGPRRRLDQLLDRETNG